MLYLSGYAGLCLCDTCALVEEFYSCVVGSGEVLGTLSFSVLESDA